MKMKKPRTDGKGILDLNKLPLPIELVLIIKSYIPKKWNVSRKPKKTNSKIYDYWGKEDYVGNYVMTDLNIGSKLNVVTGLQTNFKLFVPVSYEQ